MGIEEFFNVKVSLFFEKLFFFSFLLLFGYFNAKAIHLFNEFMKPNIYEHINSRFLMAPGAKMFTSSRVRGLRLARTCVRI